jgi:hypothetical protein
LVTSHPRYEPRRFQFEGSNPRLLH